MKLSFSLNTSKTATANKSVGDAPPLKRPAAFASLDDEPSYDDGLLSTREGGTRNSDLVAQNVLSKSAKKRMEKEQQVDATVYQYDEVWDIIQDAKSRQKEIKEQESKERKPKYIGGLLASAATRRLDHLRAEEKMIQREREAEGDEFRGKEAFVTQAYKDQMEEVRRAEEEERQREELEKRRGSSGSMAHFYRKLLEESEQKHDETVAAVQSTSRTIKGPQGSAPNLTIIKPPEFTLKSDVELALLAREQGKDVELNEDNQIVDKRELLSAGLNLSAPNTRRLGLHMLKKPDAPAIDIQRAAGSAASRKEINERRMREITTQLAEERERVKEKARQEIEATARPVSRRNHDSDIQKALERYQERKRRKLEKSLEETGS
ncbi:coiled-coil domain-containing protein 55-domain containing protein [Multifurca ochricompacta]|uniref:Coiled-coil domain-containing protein 55-domain containing protein n=1 Tax=Multifurca ochricompacta TaxID=376703 RepID=A0AAD4MCA0_9AGAM|nr:coiled-coil domain-containing protein 55-domain containing protein [Multifurca ochricompacta]